MVTRFTLEIFDATRRAYPEVREQYEVAVATIGWPEYQAQTTGELDASLRNNRRDWRRGIFPVIFPVKFPVLPSLQGISSGLTAFFLRATGKIFERQKYSGPHARS